MELLLGPISTYRRGIVSVKMVSFIRSEVTVSEKVPFTRALACIAGEIVSGEMSLSFGVNLFCKACSKSKF